jgi:hypothetical protein
MLYCELQLVAQPYRNKSNRKRFRVGNVSASRSSGLEELLAPDRRLNWTPMVGQPQPSFKEWHAFKGWYG